MKIKNNLDCPICYEVVYSSIGNGCKMCGMPLIDKNKEFCSKKCEVKYASINLKKRKDLQSK